MKFFITDKELKRLKDNAVSSELLARGWQSTPAIPFTSIEKNIEAREACDLFFNVQDPNLNIISVERVNFGTPEEETVVCYYLKDNLGTGSNEKFVRELMYRCSRKQHNLFVKMVGEARRTQAVADAPTKKVIL